MTSVEKAGSPPSLATTVTDTFIQGVGFKRLFQWDLPRGSNLKVFVALLEGSNEPPVRPLSLPTAVTWRITCSTAASTFTRHSKGGWQTPGTLSFWSSMTTFTMTWATAGGFRLPWLPPPRQRPPAALAIERYARSRQNSGRAADSEPGIWVEWHGRTGAHWLDSQGQLWQLAPWLQWILHYGRVEILSKFQLALLTFFSHVNFGRPWKLANLPSDALMVSS